MEKSTILAPPGRSELADARTRIERYAHRTPVLTSTYFDHLTGANLFFKCENFQKVGAFKFRGACNAVFSLSADELERGVVAHSSGNHAQALALAARLRGTRATIVMPENATAIKVAAVRDYGAEVVLCQPTQEAREGETARIVEETGASLIHPFNDSRIVAGQSTAAQELLEDVSGAGQYPGAGRRRWPLEWLRAGGATTILPPHGSWVPSRRPPMMRPDLWRRARSSPPVPQPLSLTDC